MTLLILQIVAIHEITIMVICYNKDYYSVISVYCWICDHAIVLVAKAIRNCDYVTLIGFIKKVLLPICYGLLLEFSRKTKSRF